VAAATGIATVIIAGLQPFVIGLITPSTTPTQPATPPPAVTATPTASPSSTASPPPASAPSPAAIVPQPAP
jgi:hypothetical protein